MRSRMASSKTAWYAYESDEVLASVGKLDWRKLKKERAREEEGKRRVIWKKSWGEREVEEKRRFLIWGEEVHSLSGVWRRTSKAWVIIIDDSETCGNGELCSVQKWRRRGKWWRLRRNFGCFVRIISISLGKMSAGAVARVFGSVLTVIDWRHWDARGNFTASGSALPF